MGRICSLATSDLIHEKAVGKESPLKGIPFSDEHKANLRHPQNTNPVQCNETGEILSTLTEAAEFYNRTPSAIIAAIKRGGKCAAMHWQRIEPKEEV